MGDAVRFARGALWRAKVARRGALVAVLTTVGAMVSPVTAFAEQAPVTVPAIRQWTAGTGSYIFAPGSRVVAVPSLAGVAATFAADLRSLTGIPVEAVTGGEVRPGDLELLHGDVPAPPEGYRLTVGRAVRIEAASGDGVFAGTRTVLQWLRRRHTLPAGTVADWPEYPERGLMVDTGRRYLSLPWLRARIRTMAYFKLNHLHLHLSDVEGFRLESTSHPEIVSPQHYTKAEITGLIAYAARYHVQVVPEIDMPGHMTAILAAHPGLRLSTSDGKTRDGLIDLAKPASYDLMRDLLTEYLPLFPSRYWHIGADEYVTDYDAYPQLAAYARAHYGLDATGKDAYHGFVNWADDLVRAAGKTTRMWNDGLKPGGATVTVHPDVVVEHWSASGAFGLPWTGPAFTARQLADAGHRVANAAFTPTYFTTGGAGSLFNAGPAAMYDRWTPDKFVDGATLSGPANLGAKVHLWCDDPKAYTEEQLGEILHDRLAVLAQQTWGSAKPAALYVLFLPRIAAVGAAPE
ncbi:family 20 glycosylhydrolase [Amycolatopsis sp. NPDC059027]|uniref:family 20 glycosylhydrolase n=1 Tax=Amycolatopsis sp. NPDC059027 TaxID=3346709 RepID=UPI003670ECBC